MPDESFFVHMLMRRLGGLGDFHMLDVLSKMSNRDDTKLNSDLQLVGSSNHLVVFIHGWLCFFLMLLLALLFFELKICILLHIQVSILVHI